jgi:PTH1 family peptidyl-tRNA hydrolase
MHLIVGLGNPERKYERNRHNVGFRVLDEIARAAKLDWGRKFSGELAQGELGATKVGILKPLTFMNLSGDAVAAAARFFKVSVEEIVVVHDELDLEFGRLQVKRGGGTAGHNGLRSIAEHLGPDFSRVRIGVGRPPAGRDGASWVLADFSAEEETALQDLVPKAAEAARMIAVDGVPTAMNHFNRRPGTS